MLSIANNLGGCLETRWRNCWFICWLTLLNTRILFVRFNIWRFQMHIPCWCLFLFVCFLSILIRYMWFAVNVCVWCLLPFNVRVRQFIYIFFSFSIQWISHQFHHHFMPATNFDLFCSVIVLWAYSLLKKKFRRVNRKKHKKTFVFIKMDDVRFFNFHRNSSEKTVSISNMNCFFHSHAQVFSLSLSLFPISLQTINAFCISFSSQHSIRGAHNTMSLLINENMN